MADTDLSWQAVVGRLGHPREHPRVVAASGEKCTRPADQAGLPLAAPVVDVLHALRPKRSMMWRLDDHERSQPRWSAAEA